jgi:hypothetical protein
MGMGGFIIRKLQHDYQCELETSLDPRAPCHDQERIVQCSAETRGPLSQCLTAVLQAPRTADSRQLLLRIALASSACALDTRISSLAGPTGATCKS